MNKNINKLKIRIDCNNWNAINLVSKTEDALIANCHKLQTKNISPQTLFSKNLHPQVRFCINFSFVQMKLVNEIPYGR